MNSGTGVRTPAQQTRFRHDRETIENDFKKLLTSHSNFIRLDVGEFGRKIPLQQTRSGWTFPPSLLNLGLQTVMRLGQSKCETGTYEPKSQTCYRVSGTKCSRNESKDYRSLGTAVNRAWIALAPSALTNRIISSQHDVKTSQSLSTASSLNFKGVENNGCVNL